jgi:glycyl-tRNA synthetase beta chain
VQLGEFLKERVRYYFGDVRGFKYDEINAVLSSGWNDLADVEERLQAIRDIRQAENFEPLAAGFRRIRNILKQAQFTGDGSRVDPSLIEAGPEKELFDEFNNVRTKATELLQYSVKLKNISTLRPAVDRFFDKVLVNAPDPAVRQNRLTLLHSMLAEFSTIADFSEIVTNFQETK